jgi:hypothetical protein
MILPMYGFLLALIFIGGLASLVAVGDPRYARRASFIGFVSLFAGLGALVLSLGLAWLLGAVFRSESMTGVGFLMGYVCGGLGGAAFGLRRAQRRGHRAHDRGSEDVRADAGRPHDDSPADT